jgi:uncharacterized protein (TIGR00730 family)
MRVTVFGSASAREDDPIYVVARDIGRRVAEAGWAVCTGGYDGTMAAVSRGAHEAGGHVVGVTMASWARFELRANPWVREEIETAGLLARLGRLLEADAFIALPGGIGTMSEVMLAWQLLQAWELPPTPFVLVGDTWPALIDGLANSLLMRPGDRDLLGYAGDAASAVEVIRRFDTEAAIARRTRVRDEMMKAHARRG